MSISVLLAFGLKLDGPLDVILFLLLMAFYGLLHLVTENIALVSLLGAGALAFTLYWTMAGKRVAKMTLEEFPVRTG